jgi:hypothetical protein
MIPIQKLLLLLLLSFCCLAMKCASSGKLESGNLNQEEIHQSYFIKRAKDALEIRATFRLKDKYGDTLALTPPSHVTYNDKEMMRRDYFMSGANYVIDEKAYQSSNTFAFTNTRGKTYSNSISFEPVEFAGNSTATLSKISQSFIPVTRIVKEDDVKITLSIKDSKELEVYSEVRSGRGLVGFRSSVYFDEAKKAIIIEPDFLKDLAEGAATISLMARKEKNAEQATGRGGELAIEYSANSVTAKVSGK